MKFLAFLAGLFLCASASAQTPTFTSLTLTGPLTVGGSATVAGAENVQGPATLGAGGSLVGSFSGPTLFSNVTPTLTPYTSSTLPAGSAGMMVNVTDCLVGASSHTGCPYVYENGSWVALTALTPNQPITIGGQSVWLGGSTTNTGTGSAIQTSNAVSPVSGHVPQYDATGALIDSGSGPGGGGGSGSVSNCATANSPAIYAASGTTASCVAGANSSILISSGGGVLSMSSTAPTGLTLPGAVLTGTGTYVTLTGSGLLTTAASTSVTAGLSVPQGAAPTSPANGNIWATSSGLFGRYNGATIGPYIGIAQISATSPIVDTAGVFSCATCATTTNGGAITATAPITISAAGLIAIAEITVGVPLLFNATTTVTNDSYLFYWPWATGHITSVKYYTGGTGTPSFTVAVKVNGTNVTGCSAISVTASNSQGSPGSTSCTSTAITTGQSFAVAVSSVAGSPFSSLIEVIGTRSAL